jgi:hypothetical protein
MSRLLATGAREWPLWPLWSSSESLQPALRDIYPVHLRSRDLDGRSHPYEEDVTVLKVILRAAAVTALLALPSLASAQVAQPGPFTGLSGHWSGAGSLASTSGTTERLRCRAFYEASADGAMLSQNLTCASDSYTFELRTDMRDEAGAIRGSWVEARRNVTGTIVGRARGGRIDASVQGPGFSATIALSTRGDRQSVTIRTDAAELSRVSIDLARTSR